MKQLTERKLVLILIAACLVFVLFGNSLKNQESAEEPANKQEIAEESAAANEFIQNSPANSQEKVIYTCRLGSEEIPAVQVSEVTDASGQNTGVVARVSAGAGIEVFAPQAVPVWDYKAVAARAGDNLIEIVYAPAAEFKDHEWILTLADKNTFFRERVRDCTEISDE